MKSHQSQKKGFAGRLAEESSQHPVPAILLVALIAVVINCYPVIFCQRSFVSPACVKAMVYPWGSPLPGDRPVPHVSQHGSDTPAMMVWSVPVGFVTSRSILDQGELPLWNRYSHAGDTLIGQNETMIGDPLQLIVILGRGAAGAWDIKFVAAKFLFCIGFGLLTRRLLGSEPMALLFTALAAYCGAFFYIDNHPVFFVFCYAPWILLSALAWLDLETGWNIRWLAGWLLVNFSCFNAGHVEVAVDLIGGLNLAALVWALARSCTPARVIKTLGRMILGTILFLGLTAPMWMAFLAALDGSFSVHQAVRVTQLSLANLPGAFDDLFYLLLLMSDDYAAVGPGTSLLVLAGCLLSALKWRQLKVEPFYWVNSGAIMLWGGFVFGWVPARGLEAIPFLNRVGHIYTDFSYLLVIHLTIQCAYGFKALATERCFRRAGLDFLWLALAFGGMMLAYSLANTHQPIPGSYFLGAAAGALGAPWLFLYLKNQRGRITAIGWAGIFILGFIPNFRFGLYNFGNDKMLLLPGPRAVLNAPSAAVKKIQAENPNPFRVVGLNSSFFGDYSAVYGIEDIRSCAPLSNGRYLDLVCRFPGMELFQGWTIEVTDITAAQPLMNLLNVKYLLTDPRTQIDMGPGVTWRVADRSDFLVLENREVWPRAFFTDTLVTNGSTEDFIKQLWAGRQMPFVSLTDSEIKKQPGLLRLLRTNPPTVFAAKNYQPLPNATAFDVHASAAGVVCLTEGQANDFTVKANGEPKEVLTVNRAFKGVYLDRPGEYHIEFSFRPRHWILAGICFWFSAGVVIVLAVMSTFCHRGKGPKRLGAQPT